MDEYASLLADLWSKARQISADRLADNTPNLVNDDIVIALIDDGVDVMSPAISGKITGGWSFDNGNPWYISKSGHGTIMAGMIVRVCPMAKIYPICLGFESDGSKKIDVWSAIAVSAHLCNPRLQQLTQLLGYRGSYRQEGDNHLNFLDHKCLGNERPGKENDGEGAPTCMRCASSLVLLLS